VEQFVPTFALGTNLGIHFKFS